MYAMKRNGIRFYWTGPTHTVVNGIETPVILHDEPLINEVNRYKEVKKVHQELIKEREQELRSNKEKSGKNAPSKINLNKHLRNSLYRRAVAIVCRCRIPFHGYGEHLAN